MYAADLLTIPSCLAGLPGLNVPVRPVRRPARGSPADRAAVRREHAFPRRACARARARVRPCAGAAARGGDVSATLGARDRARDPRAAEDADEDVLPLPRRLRRGAEHEHLPGVPRLPGRAAGAERAGDRMDDQAGARARLRDRAAGRVLPEALLLPGPAQGVSDLPVRPAFLHKRQDAGQRAKATM